MAIIRIGVDLAKNVFAVHGVDAADQVRLARSMRREQLLEVLAAVPPCLVAMEACSRAHHWARRLLDLCHTPRLIAPKERPVIEKILAHLGIDRQLPPTGQTREAGQDFAA